MHKKSLFMVMALVMALALSLGVSAATLQGDANVDGRTYPSTMPFVHPPFYNICLTVETDDSGKITAVKDNGTGLEGSLESKDMEELWVAKNKPFFDMMLKSGFLEKFVGKTRDEIAEMALNTGEADAVTGATMVGLAAQEAVLNAFDGKKGLTFLPGKGSVMPVKKINGCDVVLESKLPEGFKVELVDVRHGVRNEDVLDAKSYTAEIKDGLLSLHFENDLAPGKYFVNVVDASHTFRAPHFESGHGEEDEAQAPRFVVESGLKAEDIRMDGRQIVLENGDLANFMKNLEHVIVLAEGAEKPIEQEPVGHHGTVNERFNILTENGELNPDATLYNKKDRTETPIFEKGKTYEITIVSYGYPELNVNYTAE
ncbi:MAG TPA: hypothetical protein GXZ91_08270 [Christensenellaceae bacterium]|nr:hypothetical protein [Christensenellaceae bacterium]